MASSANGTVVGGILGAALLGPEGTIPGSLLGGFLAGLLPEPKDILSDVLAEVGVAKLNASARFVRNLFADEQEAIDALQKAVQDAFREAVVDIGGRTCFPREWRTRRATESDVDVIFHVSALRETHGASHHAQKVCDCLRALADSASSLMKQQESAVWLGATPEQAIDLRESFHTELIAPWLESWDGLCEDLRAYGIVYDLEGHLRRCLLPQTIVRMGVKLEENAEVWRVFNRMMWQSLQTSIAGSPLLQDQLQETIKQLQQLNDDHLQRSAALITAVGELMTVREDDLIVLIGKIDLHTEILANHVSAEHETTRQLITDAVEQLLKAIPHVANSGHSVLELQTIIGKYHEAVAAKLRTHHFRGIAQFRSTISLPLDAVYQDLGLLPWQDSDEVVATAAMLIGGEDVRQQALEHRLAQRIDGGVCAFARLVIVGDPGSGKTMTLKYVALMLALGKGSERLKLPHSLVPVYLRLSDYAKEGNRRGLENYLLAYVQDEYAIVGNQLADVLRVLLESGRCLLLLDGLDEIDEKSGNGMMSREDVAVRVAQFASSWVTEERGNRLLVTSRKEGYSPELLPAFQHAELSPLRPPDEIQRFLLNWYTAHARHNDPQLSHALASRQAQSIVKELLPRILGSASVKRLATNPLLLTVLVLVHNNVGHIPDRRAKLYKICAQTLVESWREAQTNSRSAFLKEVGEPRLFRVLGRLAYWLHEHRPGGTASVAEWERQLTTALSHDVTESLQIDTQRAGGLSTKSQHDIDTLVKAFLDHARFDAGLLSERGLDQIGFFHLTMEEYLAGYCIAHATQREQHQMVKAHWEDPRWREPILLAVGELSVVMQFPEGTQDFLNRLLDLEPSEPSGRGRQVVLAGRALLDAGLENVPSATARKIESALLHVMQDKDPHTGQTAVEAFLPIVRFSAGSVLDSLGWLPEDLNHWEACPADPPYSPGLMVMRYPVTNVHYEQFILAGGYDNSEMWGGENSDDWTWRNRPPSYRGDGPVTEPEFWLDSRFGSERRGFPVVGVSWYEATAFARWISKLLLSARRGDPLPVVQIELVAELLASDAQCVRLPTEEEWERIAGGIVGGRYPWDSASQTTTDLATIIRLSNVGESDIRQTTPVAMYPDGRAASGVVDLAGNVWEWTESQHVEDDESRVLRGGSWDYGHDRAQVAARLPYSPQSSYSNLGFRLVASNQPG